jgi:hypothetical protein
MRWVSLPLSNVESRRCCTNERENITTSSCKRCAAVWASRHANPLVNGLKGAEEEQQKALVRARAKFYRRLPSLSNCWLPRLSAVIAVANAAALDATSDVQVGGAFAHPILLGWQSENNAPSSRNLNKRCPNPGARHAGCTFMSHNPHLATLAHGAAPHATLKAAFFPTQGVVWFFVFPPNNVLLWIRRTTYPDPRKVRALNNLLELAGG